MIPFEEYRIEPLTNFSKLDEFYTGKKKMDDFLHNCLEDCEESHYCHVFAPTPQMDVWPMYKTIWPEDL